MPAMRRMKRRRCWRPDRRPAFGLDQETTAVYTSINHHFTAEISARFWRSIKIQPFGGRDRLDPERHGQLLYHRGERRLPFQPISR